MKVLGVDWWRWPLFLAYLGLLGFAAAGGLWLVVTFRVAALLLGLLFVAAVLAWPHRLYLRALVRC